MECQEKASESFLQSVLGVRIKTRRMYMLFER